MYETSLGRHLASHHTGIHMVLYCCLPKVATGYLLGQALTGCPESTLQREYSQHSAPITLGHGNSRGTGWLFLLPFCPPTHSRLTWLTYRAALRQRGSLLPYSIMIILKERERKNTFFFKATRRAFQTSWQQGRDMVVWGADLRPDRRLWRRDLMNTKGIFFDCKCLEGLFYDVFLHCFSRAGHLACS